MIPTIPWMIVAGYVAAWFAMAVYMAERDNEDDDRIYGRDGARRLRSVNAFYGLVFGSLWPVVLLVWFIEEVAEE